MKLDKEMGTKICTKCKIEKPVGEFYKSKNWCKCCTSRYAHKYGDSLKDLHERAEMLMYFRTLKRDIKKYAERG